ncbi:MAG: hypothetical protein KJ646_03965 [Nanoarchaeota archaeon]|nr:hypothetical protein [Nanoarchaeota archaeon]MBU4116149.1 hypothetical protein [Nanoarchaeota archaeon]
MLQNQDIFIFGASGNVGSELTKQIIKFDHHRKITGVASSNYVIYNAKGLKELELKKFLEKPSGDSYQTHKEILKNIRAEQINPTFFVDVTSSENIYQTHLQIVEDHFFGGMVTANKNPLVIDLEIFRKLTSNPNKYGFQCSVMAGAGALAEIKRSSELSDPVTSIEGCFSGTLAFIIYKMRKGTLFSEAFSEACKLGYTESDPRLDLSGLDVAKKLLILVRQNRHEVNLDDILLEPFLPKEAFAQKSLSTFLSQIPNYNSHFSDLIAKAQKNGNTLQYIARFFSGDKRILNKEECSRGPPISIPITLDVKLREISQNDLLGNLKYALNGCEIKTNIRYPDFFTITAPGAGLPVTAGNIRDDLNKLRIKTLSNHFNF